MPQAPIEQTGNERHRFIKGYLAMKGVTFADIAREVQMSRAMVALVSRGERRSRDIEEAFVKHGIPRALLEAV
ncbi:MAG: hypothetical protein WAN11_17770 [Syntrophobacteraceae bacterium]